MRANYDNNAVDKCHIVTATESTEGHHLQELDALPRVATAIGMSKEFLNGTW
jgi:hypothetical protein